MEENKGMEGIATQPEGAAARNDSTEVKFTQADIDRIIKERLEREKSARDKSAAKAREEAEAEGLKKSEEWQTLANKLDARVKELEPLGEQVTRYKGALESYLQAERKGLPKHITALLDKLDLVDQIEYLSANREEISKGSGAAGVPASPSPRGRGLTEEEKEAARRGQSSLYNNF